MTVSPVTLAGGEVEDIVDELFRDLEMNELHCGTVINEVVIGYWKKIVAARFTRLSQSPSMFDLLEQVCARLDETGFRGTSLPIRGAFARGTGGVDLEYLVQRFADALSQSPIDG